MMFRFITIVFSVFLLVFNAFLGTAQSTVKKIQIVNSDSLTFEKSKGADLKLLYGHVIFKQDEIIMHCDSARFYSTNNVFDAYGSIHITQGDTVDVWGDSLHYDGNTKLAQLRGKLVKMRDRKMILTTRFFDYDMNASVGKYFEGGKIIDDENTLSSNTGIYYADKKELYFKDKVKLQNKEYDVSTDTLKYNTNNHIAYFLGSTIMTNKETTVFTKKGWYNTKIDVAQLERDSWVKNKGKKINADSIYYDKKKGLGRAIKNVVIKDTTQHLTIKGDYAYFKEKPEYYFVKNNVVAEKEFEGDTLFLHSDTLIGFKIDTVSDNRIIKAYHKVRFFKKDIQGQCDSLVYKTKDSVIIMNTQPILWSEKSQITAKLISIFLKNNEVDNVKIDDMAFIISQENDSINFNQVKGAKMVAYFENRKFSKLDVMKNGETVYFMRDGNSLTGVNKAECENLTVLFKNEEVDEVIFRQKPKGTMFPPNKILSKDSKLQDFNWQENVRPKNKNDIFRWVE